MFHGHLKTHGFLNVRVLAHVVYALNAIFEKNSKTFFNSKVAMVITAHIETSINK